MDPKKILLIEDEIFVRELYEHTLSEAGYKVILARDGQEGIDQAGNLPDLILLDILLPTVNGLEVLKRLKQDEKTSHIPIIMLTNLGQDEIVKKSFNVGANGYLMKAKITPYQIVSYVRDFLEKHE